MNRIGIKYPPPCLQALLASVAILPFLIIRPFVFLLFLISFSLFHVPGSDARRIGSHLLISLFMVQKTCFFKALHKTTKTQTLMPKGLQNPSPMASKRCSGIDFSALGETLILNDPTAFSHDYSCSGKPRITTIL